MALATATIPSPASPQGIHDLEAELGKGWKCPAVPDGFNAVGTIFVRKPNGETSPVAFVGDAGSMTVPAYVGPLKTSKHYTIDVALAIVGFFFPSISLGYDSSNNVSVELDNTYKIAGLDAVDARAIAWASNNQDSLKNGKRLFVVRDALTAGQLSYTFDKAITAAAKVSIGAQTPSVKAAATTGALSSGGVPSGSSVTVSTPGVSGSLTMPSQPSTATPTPSMSTATAPTSPTASPTAGVTSTISSPKSKEIVQTFSPAIGACIHMDEVNTTATRFTGSSAGTFSAQASPFDNADQAFFVWKRM